MPGLEVTITHSFRGDPRAGELTAELYKRRWIGLHWGRRGSDPESYEQGAAQRQVRLFVELAQEGGAVVAAYKGATSIRGERLVGVVEPGTEFEYLFPEEGVHKGLLCLPLTRVQRHNASRSFLANLAPRSCAFQPCHNRALGRLSALAEGRELERSVFGLHDRDIEWLVSNYLLVSELVAVTWAGVQSVEDVDHFGFSAQGRRVLAQTTKSKDVAVVARKAAKLAAYAPAAETLLFAPAGTFDPSTAPEVGFKAIEEVFEVIDATVPGRMMLDSMLGVQLLD